MVHSKNNSTIKKLQKGRKINYFFTTLWEFNIKPELRTIIYKT